MHRFFVEPRQISGNSVTITGDDVNHIRRVLRLKPGDTIVLCDGQATDYTATIQQLNDHEIFAAIEDQYESETEPAYQVTLFQGLPKAGKLETIIQKSVELGVSTIVPMLTQHCDVRPDESFSKKLIRYQRVAYEAAKQCRRGIVPQISTWQSMMDCDFSAFDLVLLAYEEEKLTTLKHVLQDSKAFRIAILIGPEGGFSPAEVQFLKEKRAIAVSLGSRILRTETAGPAMLAMLLYELEG